MVLVDRQIVSVFWVGTAVMLFVAFLLIFLVLFYQNKIIAFRRKEADLMLRTALESENKERMRIAADLHDGVAGDLNAVRNFLTVAKRQPRSSAMAPIFDEIDIAMQNAVSAVRDISYNLMPPNLENLGLCDALEQYFARMSSATGICYSMRCGEKPQIDAYVTYEIYRIIQEFSTNFSKHGHGSAFSFTIERSMPQTLILQDNGRQYDFLALQGTATGSGLKNIISRIKVINAEMIQLPVPSGNKFIIKLKSHDKA